jgi:hypothetical protein
MRTALSTLTRLLSAGPPPAADFALRDGDTVVFLGDSITAARTYGKIIEDYTLRRFPDRVDVTSRLTAPAVPPALAGLAAPVRAACGGRCP